MSKKKNKKKNQNHGQVPPDLNRVLVSTSKKKLNKDFKKAIKDIENMQMAMFEADKRDHKMSRKAINKNQADFYTEINGIKYRKKLAKKWEKTGFLDEILDMLKEVSPLIKTLAKLVATLIVTFLSLDSVKSVISPNILKKLATIFDIVQAV